jgi:hypothetical protein
MNNEETKKILAAISAVYTNAKFNAGSVAIWSALFKEIAYSDVEQACFDFFKTPAQFPPVPGDIFASLQKKALSQFPSATDAWQEVMRIASPYKRKERSTLDDQIQRVMRGIGWERVERADVDKELPWLKKAFVEAYQHTTASEAKLRLPHYIDMAKQLELKELA